MRAVAHSLRLDEQHERAVGQEIREQMVALAQPGQPRLHAVEDLTLGQTLPLLPAPRLLGHECGRPGAHLVGGEQLAGREDARFGEVVGRPLVGNRERREAIDLVAPQVDAHRMVIGRRVDVDDRTAHGQLAARLDLVLAPVATGDEAGHELVAVDVVAGRDDDRFDLLDVRARAAGRAPAPVRRRSPGARPARSRHITRRRRPMVSNDGDTRSKGRVSQAGKYSTSSAPTNCARSRTSRSASASVGTASDQGAAGGDGGERGHEQRPRRLRYRDNRLAGHDGAERRLVGEQRDERAGGGLGSGSR